ncbi:hypothetical protein C0V70_04360 [Bacteriovorax stolpii]|uniref:Uncharacterized protein n=1 Tax=Bacteriovorax stolpii TaxID=960 RepID=A0A2K9NQL9_BACTC|nr:hypothetical protein [Bacteriovorax stolpii]AUN97355.1 hypothetical protein C0V70_04360 [Bacteriovorax stolpii]TDP52526.1 hypothetical protein C8D79_2291 [Bacteriovorax stolpii]
MEDALFKIHLATSWFMTGLIWLIQIVHYPLFTKVCEERFKEYHSFHTRNITFIVAPVMLVELASFLGLIFLKNSESLNLVFIGFLFFVIWATTIFLSVPAHERLSAGLDHKACKQLVISNWLRVGAWSLKSIYLLLQS